MKQKKQKSILNKKLKLLLDIDKNINAWKILPNCNERFIACEEAINFAKSNGNFVQGGIKTLSQALKISESANLEGAFIKDILIGIICQESSFGTNIPIKPNIVGPFQIGSTAMMDYNNKNPSNKILYPSEIDNYQDLKKSAKAAAWYYAFCLQQLTFSTQYLNPIVDIYEAKKFAVASYNAGVGLIRATREITNDSNGGKSIWNIAKTNLISAGATAAKAKEVIDYVDRVMDYSIKSTSCWCDHC